MPQMEIWLVILFLSRKKFHAKQICVHSSFEIRPCNGYQTCCSLTEMMLYHNESLDLMLRRWAKLEKDFKTKLGVFDITKIPDIYDCIKYDLLHNEKIISSLGFTEMGNLYLGAQLLADVIIPQVRVLSSSLAKQPNSKKKLHFEKSKYRDKLFRERTCYIHIHT